MAEDTDNKVKIRFKFKSGEEFEAEGSPEFIEKQRADFLQIIGKDRARTGKSTASSAVGFPGTNTAVAPLSQAAAPAGIGPIQEEALAPQNTPQQSFPAEDTWVSGVSEPAFYRRGAAGEAAAPSYSQAASRSAYAEQPGAVPHLSLGIAAMEAAQRHPAPTTLTGMQEIRLWEQLVRLDEHLVILRRKSRQLSAGTAALVLLAAAQILLKEVGGYSALALSKSLKKSGYGGDRLDRVLGGEIKQGNICSEGMKRSRVYKLTDSGFARAYVLAEKLAEEWH